MSILNKTILSCVLILLIFAGCAKKTSDDTAGDVKAKVITSVKVGAAPVIDGSGEDAAWTMSKAVTTRDKIAAIDISLKTVYTNDEIFFLVKFSDPDESRQHKALIWDKETEIYKDGPKREDTFVFKWAMDQSVDDLTLSADRPYEADIWFWKADRTGPPGYADDKMHKYSVVELLDSLKVRSKSGKYFYLVRPGDEGKSAYETILYDSFSEDEVPKFKNRTPEGSRADVQAKGKWFNHEWTIEFKRKLKTGNKDDIAFDITKTYLFGVSRFEIAGREPEPEATQPNYGVGEVNDMLKLQFRR